MPLIDTHLAFVKVHISKRVALQYDKSAIQHADGCVRLNCRNRTQIEAFDQKFSYLSRTRWVIDILHF